MSDEEIINQNDQSANLTRNLVLLNLIAFSILVVLIVVYVFVDKTQHCP